MLIIRRAVEQDIPFLDEKDNHDDAAMIRRKIEQGEENLALLDDQPIGWVRYGLFWDELPVLYQFVILPPSRGRGFGSALLEAWKVEMRAAGYEQPPTTTSSSNRVQSLYHRLGYEEIGGVRETPRR